MRDVDTADRGSSAVMRRATAGLAVLATIPFMIGAAHASCSGGTVKFNPAKNDAVSNQITVDQSGCRITYSVAKGAKVKFDLVTEPRNGALEQDESGAVVYTPRAGYSGSDDFLLKICPELSGKRVGCSSVTYHVTVVAQPILPANLTAAQRCLIEVNERFTTYYPQYRKRLVDAQAAQPYMMERQKCLALEQGRP
jgi:hypothetical protein